MRIPKRQPAGPSSFAQFVSSVTLQARLANFVALSPGSHAFRDMPRPDIRVFPMDRAPRQRDNRLHLAMGYQHENYDET
jgi:hypothetical protein